MTSATKQFAIAGSPPRLPALEHLTSRLNWEAIAVLAAVLAAWQFITSFGWIPAVILPQPTAVLAALWEQSGQLVEHGLGTSSEIVAGFIGAVILGVFLALVISLSRTIEETLYPLLIVMQTIPKIALAPVFMVWFGIGFESRLVFATFIGFFPIAVTLATGLREANPGSLRLCSVLGASRWQTLIHVRFPYALPYFFNGLKVSVTLATIGVVTGELISSQSGLGHLIVAAASRMDTAMMLAAIAVLCVVGLLLFKAVDLLERVVRARCWP